MVDMTKRTETAQQVIVDLGKRTQASGKNLGDDISARVVLALDYSGSMANRYDNGEVQDVVERVLALSLAGLDDDGDIQIHPFHDGTFSMEEVNENNYSGFVQKWMRGKRMGGTAYTPVMKNILKDVGGKRGGLFRKNTPVDPMLVLFVTDGEPTHDNNASIERLLRETADQPVFWQFIGIGPDRSTAYLDRLNNLDGRSHDNTGLTRMVDTKGLSDVDFFNKVLEEFVTEWLPDAKARGIVK